MFKSCRQACCFGQRPLPCHTAVTFWHCQASLRPPCPPAHPQADGAAALAAWRARLSYYVYEAVGGLRIADMFDIVVDWPDRWGGLWSCLQYMHGAAFLRQPSE